MNKIIIFGITLILIILNDLIFDKLINKKKNIQITFTKNLFKNRQLKSHKL